ELHRRPRRHVDGPEGRRVELLDEREELLARRVVEALPVQKVEAVLDDRRPADELTLAGDRLPAPPLLDQALPDLDAPHRDLERALVPELPLHLHLLPDAHEFELARLL